MKIFFEYSYVLLYYTTSYRYLAWYHYLMIYILFTVQLYRQAEGKKLCKRYLKLSFFRVFYNVICDNHYKIIVHANGLQRLHTTFMLSDNKLSRVMLGWLWCGQLKKQTHTETNIFSPLNNTKPTIFAHKNKKKKVFDVEEEW